MLGDRFALGVVPSFLRNARLNQEEVENAFSVGIMGQLYVSVRPGRMAFQLQHHSAAPVLRVLQNHGSKFSNACRRSGILDQGSISTTR